MTSKNSKASHNSLGPIKRLSALVLLLFIAHGAIAGAAHTHGSIRQQFVAENAEFRCTDVGVSQSSSGPVTTRGDCLICGLHRNLDTGLLGKALITDASITGFAFPRSFRQLIYSQTSAPNRGRAPPIFIS